MLRLGGEVGQVLQVLDALGLDRLLGHRDDRQRRILERGGAALSGDDDVLEPRFAGRGILRFGRFGDLRDGRRGAQRQQRSAGKRGCADVGITVFALIAVLPLSPFDPAPRRSTALDIGGLR